MNHVLGRKYPLFGLSEISNFTVENPINGEIETSIDDIRRCPSYLPAALYETIHFRRPFQGASIPNHTPTLPGFHPKEPQVSSCLQSSLTTGQ